MNPLQTRVENADFLESAYKQVWMAAGANEEHANAVARALSFGDRMGKLTQGLGVFEVIIFTLRGGNLDIQAVPEIVREGKNWVLYEGHRTSGQWMLTIAMHKAIEKARECAVSIAMARNHNDAGCFGAYTHIAAENQMLGLATNNSMPLVAPWGGAENVLSGAPLSAALPGGAERPILCDIACLEAGPGKVTEAVFNSQKLAGKFLVDPDTGALTDNPKPYFKEIKGYARICDSDAASVFGSARLYALNVITEMFASLIVPGARITPDLPHPPSEWLQPQNMGSVGGSFILVIDPSHFGDIDEVKRKSDRFVRAIKRSRPLPGTDEILLPGERGLRTMRDSVEVKVLQSHWKAFEKLALELGVNIQELRSRWRQN